MITIIASVVLLCAGPKGTAPHNWIQDLLASPKAKKVTALVKATKNKKKTVPASSGKVDQGGFAAGPGDFNISSHRVFEDPVDDARFNAANSAKVESWSLMRQGDYEAGYAKITAFRREQPEAAVYTDGFTADCANMTGRYEEAFNLLVPMIRRANANNATLGPTIYLALALASSGMGQVYDGQAEFCRSHAIQGLNTRHLNMKLDAGLTRRTDAKTVAVLSCMAFGLEFGNLPFLEKALSLNPTNVIATRTLMPYYQLRGQKADMIRIASGMVKNLPTDDPNRADFEIMLSETK